jgi:transcriptional regulator with XRE-family HTH domain
LSSEDLDPRHRRLAEKLKQLRRDAGLSAAALGEPLGWSQSKVSKLENARSSFTVPDIQSWLDRCNADDATRAEVLELAVDLGTRVRPWRRANRPDYETQQRARAAQDAETSGIAVFQSEVVPGILQTSEYARRLLEVHSLVPPDSIPATVIARLDRQAVLFDESKQFDIIITEAALRWRPGSVSLALAQLDRIGSLAALPNVSIGVITREAMETAKPLHSFVILRYADEPAVVQIETLTAEQEVTEPDDVALYEEFFADQRRHAVYGDDLYTLLARISDELRSLTASSQ